MLALIVQPFSKCVALNHEKGDSLTRSFLFFGVKTTTFVYDEDGKLKCSSCGSHTFDMVAEMRISDVSKNENDPVANRTTESENIVSLVCARCGVRIR